MIKKEQLCAAFCGDIELSEVPAGLAVRTGFYTPDGDAIGFYVVRSPFGDKYRVEDSGLIVPMLEASGVNLTSGTRAEAFKKLLNEHGAEFDSDAMQLSTQYVDEADVPAEAMRFISLMLRIQDLELLSPETVENTFREDAERALRKTIEGKGTLKFKSPPANNLTDFEADAVIHVPSHPAVAVYFGTSESRVDEAVMLWMDNRYQNHGLKVVLLLERDRPTQIPVRNLRRALNRLDATTVFRGDESGAMSRIAETAGISMLH